MWLFRNEQKGMAISLEALCPPIAPSVTTDTSRTPLPKGDPHHKRDSVKMSESYITFLWDASESPHPTPNSIFTQCKAIHCPVLVHPSSLSPPSTWINPTNILQCILKWQQCHDGRWQSFTTHGIGEIHKWRAGPLLCTDLESTTWPMEKGGQSKEDENGLETLYHRLICKVMSNKIHFATLRGRGSLHHMLHHREGQSENWQTQTVKNCKKDGR